jgi:hypothetical protein
MRLVSLPVMLRWGSVFLAIATARRVTLAMAYGLVKILMSVKQATPVMGRTCTASIMIRQ